MQTAIGRGGLCDYFASKDSFGLIDCIGSRTANCFYRWATIAAYL